MVLRRFSFASALLFGALMVPPAARAATCDSLKSLTLDHTTVTMAQVVGAGEFTPPAGGGRGRGPQAEGAGRANAPTRGDVGAARGAANPNAFRQLPAFCRVALTIAPTSDSDIKVEVWLPLDNWNNKYMSVGNNGWGGAINYPLLADALRRGYATSSTDTGHTGNNGSFALGHPEKYIDYSYRSEHEMAVQSKAVVNAFYTAAPKLSYWNGCSLGGRQGLREVQSYPDDFDAVIAGAPANPRSRLAAWGVFLGQTAFKEPGNAIPESKFAMIHDAVLNACDALDGVKDGIINDPAKCKFDYKSLLCKGDDGPNCLTAGQVKTAQTLTTPAVSAKTKQLLYPQLMPGSENAWNVPIGGPEPNPVNMDQFKYVIYNDANWDWRKFDLETDLSKAEKFDGGKMTDAVNPDLSAFHKHGGKLLMYHGWGDANVPPMSTINYLKSVQSKMGGASQTDSWARLFMVPAMAHCGGGEGPNQFDMVAALEQWVEQGKAPAQVIASRVTNTEKGEVTRTRPLCPYPQVAQYKGSGSTDDAANFVCK